MNLPERIRNARGTRSREAFAAACGCSLATVIRWESGATTPTDHRHVEALVREGISRADIVAASGVAA